MIRHHLYYNRHYRHINFLLLSIILLSMQIALSFAVQHSLAYIQPKGSNISKPLRAWMCSGKSNKQLVDNLAAAGIVKSPINKKALLAVDRRNYVLNTDYAYEDSPQPIGYHATISAPHMHAHVLEDLLPPLIQASKNDPTKALKLLDVGCGSGYLTAVFGRMLELVKGKGKVFGIDVIPELVAMSLNNIQKEDGDLFESNTVEVMVGDGWKGYPAEAPYNAIHVGAAAATFPKDLLNQLCLGGVMVIPVGPDGGIQHLYRVERGGDRGEVVGERNNDHSKGFVEDDFEIQKLLGVRYVPLVQSI